ncbi:MAG: gliding motility-associated C-terminal domain-containing protein, partial [Bacteroidales bacterium]|nr:gliding motility-associated C-terminal domain-containing protein [Bacteroidales bacterium]
DGVKNYFDFNAPNAEQITVKIYNSAGMLVFESDHYGETEESFWRGENMNGQKLPEGTYFYIASIKVAGKEQEVLIKSFVEILRMK